MAAIFDPETSDLYFVLDLEILLAHLEGQLMLLPPFDQHPHEQHPFDLPVGNQLPQMAKRTYFGVDFSLHALLVVSLIALAAQQRGLFAGLDEGDVLAAETHHLVA